MKQWGYVGLVLVLAAGAAACGQSAEEKRAEELKKAAEAMQENAGDIEKNAQEMAKGLEAMAKGVAGVGGSGDQKTVEPVDFRLLQEALPELSGWEREKPTGEKMTIPVTFSSASTNYTRGDARISAKITDSGFNQLLIAPVTMMLASGYSKESSDGYEKSTTVAGQPAMEKWTTDDKRAELTLFVNKRFVVELEGSGLADVKDLHALASKMDLKKLPGAN